MTHTILAHLFSLMTLVMAPSADGAGAHEGRHGKRAELCERLECTDDQRAKIDAIRTTHREATADERAEAKRLHQALKLERSKAEPNAEELARLEAALYTVKTSLKQQREASKAEISAVLTPEQRERFDAMKAKHGRDGKGKGKAHAKRDGKGKGKGKAYAKRSPEGKGKAHAKRGPEGKGKAHAKRGPEGRGKAFAGRERRGRDARLAG
jgi:Spy/CpxP family protein refolding chaperone